MCITTSDLYDHDNLRIEAAAMYHRIYVISLSSISLFLFFECLNEDLDVVLLILLNKRKCRTNVWPVFAFDGVPRLAAEISRLRPKILPPQQMEPEEWQNTGHGRA